MQQATQKNISKEDLLRVWKRKRESKPTSLPLSGLRVQGDCWEPGRRAAEVYEIITTERYWSFWWVGRWKTFWQLGQWWSCGGKAPPTRPQGPFRSALFLGFTLNFSRTPPCPFRPPLPPPTPSPTCQTRDTLTQTQTFNSAFIRTKYKTEIAWITIQVPGHFWPHSLSYSGNGKLLPCSRNPDPLFFSWSFWKINLHSAAEFPESRLILSGQKGSWQVWTGVERTQECWYT